MEKIKFWALAIGSIIFLWLLTPEPKEADYSHITNARPAASPNSPNEFPQQSAQLPSPMYAHEAMQQLIESGAVPSLRPKGSKPLHPSPVAESFRLEKIRFQTKRGILPLIAGIADTDGLRERGMMYFKQWPKGMHGLLFLFDRPEVITMWMKNTYLPLDMLFLNDQNRIVHIVENTTPLSEAIISSQRRAKAVLEIPAGAARKWQLSVGDTLLPSTAGN